MRDFTVSSKFSLPTKRKVFDVVVAQVIEVNQLEYTRESENPLTNEHVQSHNTESKTRSQDQFLSAKEDSGGEAGAETVWGGAGRKSLNFLNSHRNAPPRSLL